MFFVVQNEEIRMIEQTDIKRLSQQNAKVRLSGVGLEPVIWQFGVMKTNTSCEPIYYVGCRAGRGLLTLPLAVFCEKLRPTHLHFVAKQGFNTVLIHRV